MALRTLAGWFLSGVVGDYQHFIVGLSFSLHSISSLFVVAVVVKGELLFCLYPCVSAVLLLARLRTHARACDCCARATLVLLWRMALSSLLAFGRAAKGEVRHSLEWDWVHLFWRVCGWVLLVGALPLFLVHVHVTHHNEASCASPLPFPHLLECATLSPSSRLFFSEFLLVVLALSDCIFCVCVCLRISLHCVLYVLDLHRHCALSLRLPLPLLLFGRGRK